ncbi:MAG: 3-keto-5-aminohexanoate cleavage protein [Oscillospiraceae bacterium]|mgnify:FL=1|uniref:3-keto-5-aminohexanoate cleavage protein n=1 Tax=Intestinimonas sp. TaxID=1965293 RepID=UPI0006BFBFFC|nr:3-keto-5-aminohexanoate cleavage protein [Oscillospiraceae bacterium]BDE88662.1 3-keto-5-aminohexanoate cleavage protein [Oscillospiraceae bacterium]CUQ59377.1 Uncharacterized conserved protein [Flavonifractor plautii]SCJ17280.1 Uncharacterized conserved protein [uncultured Flavonifractor sp.]
MNKALITAAITGAIHVPTQTEYLPITPDQIADEAIAACQAGAAVVHIHVRDPKDGHPSADIDMFKTVCKKIKDNCNALICVTTGGDPTTMTLEQRLRPVSELEPELASFNGGSFNFSMHPIADKFETFQYEWERPHLLKSEDNIHYNTFKSMREYLDLFAEKDTKPEFEIYDMGQLSNLAFMIKGGKIKMPVDIQFILGVLGGLPATVENLVHMVDQAEKVLGKGNFVWSVVGAGKMQMQLGAVALAMGGNVRVGLEDSVWLEKGVKAKSNAEQVTKIIRIAKELGREIATPDEARGLLKVKGEDKVKF